MSIDHLHLYSGSLASVSREVEADQTVSEEKLNAAFLEELAALPFGHPFSFVEQHGGGLVQNVRPVVRHENEQSSRGRAALRLHTDDAFLHPRVRVEYIALCGVSNPHRVPTDIVHIDDVRTLLEPAVAEALGQPVFSFGCPESYDIEGRESIWATPRWILNTNENGELEVTLPSTSVRIDPGLAAEFGDYVTAFQTALANAPRRQVVLERGEILVVSNRRCLHGRPAIEAERWLKRVYLSRDLSGLEEVAGTGLWGIYTAAKAFDYSG